MTAWQVATPWAFCAALLLVAAPARAQSPEVEPVHAAPLASAAPAAAASESTTTGLAIYQRFREGLADPDCTSAPSTRWRTHFISAPQKLASGRDDLLPLFGYVVDALREASLPTEYALIPFVESGYKPGARSPSGPAGLWQMITITARNHKVPIRPGYDGRYSPVDSTRAAVRYLKTLHGMFAGDWRLAVMAYNAGEYRVLQSMRKAGMNAQNAKPSALPGLSPVTHAYVEKLHALACVLEDVEDQPGVMASLDRTVPVLKDHTLPAGTSVQQWAAQRALDPARIACLNPALASGGRPSGTTRVLAPPQDLTGGTLAFTLVPGRIAAIRFAEGTGDRTALRKRYSELVRTYHPDRTGGDRSHSINVSTISALVVAGAGELVQISRIDDAVADAVGDAPLQQWLQLRDPRLGQVQLADRLRAFREHRLQRIQAVQSQLGVAALACRIDVSLGRRIDPLPARARGWWSGTTLAWLPRRTRIMHGHLPPESWRPVYPAGGPNPPANACTWPAASRTPGPRTATAGWRTPRRRSPRCRWCRGWPSPGRRRSPAVPHP